MSRIIRGWVGLFAAWAVLAVVGASVGAAPAVPEPEGKKGATVTSMAKKLSERVSLKEGVKDVPMKDVLEMLTDRFELTILIDPIFNKMGGPEAGAGVAAVAVIPNAQTFEQTPVKLPKLVNVRLDTILKLVLSQGDAGYLIYPDHIRVVPLAALLYETGQKQANPTNPNEETLLPQEVLDRVRPLPQRAVVTLAINRVPLAEAIEELADMTGATVVLAPQAGDKGKTPVTARLVNVPLETAVRLLADMADLKVVVRANVLYVTTPERAAAWEKEEDRERAERLRATFGPGGLNPGVPGMNFPGLGLGNVGLGLGANDDVVKALRELEKANQDLIKLIRQLQPKAAEPAPKEPAANPELERLRKEIERLKRDLEREEQRSKKE